ncbi:hypothetical protein [Phyllobacterium sp. OV277]|uniref:hypothetical protein n=1 Tax=Phyllobacterium sp. OV277 TaxID=1882772 RepID=UPI00088A0179|nr:hypothetical protein [Phyllobacterium sp. OV277]SDP12882.1 hypothetical protein SAMN05443582_103479 [Phyllobacterium sp. OV277]
MRRTLSAFLVSPLWVPLLAAVYAAVFWKTPDFMEHFSQMELFSVAIAIGAMLGYGIILTFGAIAHRLLWSNRRTSILMYASVFSGIALLSWCALLIGGWAFGEYGIQFGIHVLVDTVLHRPYVPGTACVLGALVGSTFWAIARPDRKMRTK